MADLVSHPRCRLNVTKIECNESELFIYGFNYEFIAAIKRKPIEGSRSIVDYNAQRDLQLDTLIMERTMVQNEFLGNTIFEEDTDKNAAIEHEIDQIMDMYR